MRERLAELRRVYRRKPILVTSSISSVLFSVAAYYIAYRWLGYSHDAAKHMLAIVMVAMLLHEIVHWQTMERFGVRCHVLFVAILGGVRPIIDNDPLRLTPLQAAISILSGPMANVTLMLVGLGMHQAGFYSGFGLAMASFNAAMISLNLLPLPLLDGGRFFKTLYHNSDRHGDLLLTVVGMAMAISSGLLVYHVHRLNPYPVLVATLVIYNYVKGEPKVRLTPAYTRRRFGLIGILVWAIIWSSSFYLFLALPSWMGIYRH